MILFRRLRKGIKNRVQDELVDQGWTEDEAQRRVDTLEDDDIADAVRQAKATNKVKGLGDGVLLQKIIEFIKSPAGQLIVSIIIKFLTGGVLEKQPGSEETESETEE